MPARRRARYPNRGSGLTPSARAVDQTCAFTLLPVLASEDAPLACTCCNRLFRKLCSPALEDPLDEEAGEVAATPALPFTPFTRFWNVDVSVSVAAVGLPFGPTC